jgi:hypothetical protein
MHETKHMSIRNELCCDHAVKNVNVNLNNVNEDTPVQTSA